MMENLVNLSRYPIHDLDSSAGERLLAKCRNEMMDVGICMLSEFLTPGAIDRMKAEANSQLGNAFYCSNTHNAYLREDDPSLPTSHPGRRLLRTEVGSIANDFLPADGALVRLYKWNCLTDFIGQVLGYEHFYRSADPLGALSVNVFQPGGSHAWHFDESKYTVTVMLQPAESGGEFEVVANVRTQDDDNYDRVASILDGDYDAVVRLPFAPGTLFIFAGRHSLHRVTDVQGSRPRLVPVLAYAEHPEYVNSKQVRRLFWGRDH